MKLLATLVLTMSMSVVFSQQYSKVKIYTDSDGLQTLAELGVPVDHGIRKQNTFLISDFSEQEIEIIASNGFMFEILVDDVKQYYAGLNANFAPKNNTCATSSGPAAPTVPVNFETDASSYAGFYTYQQMLDALDDMATQYPNLITIKAPISSFMTWENRPIYHVKISDNPSTDEASEPNILYTAVHHAREPMSMSQTIFYMWYLLENYATNEEVQFLVDNTEMYFVPCVNPDGYLENEASDPAGFGMHRKNKRPVGGSNPGVDLNRNYSYGWGTTGVDFDPSSDTYPGGPDDGNDYSFSEPETQAIQWLAENVGFVSAFNSHTYGNTLLHPIGTTNNEFADHHDYFTDLTIHMCSRNGYFPQKSSGLYPASGDADDYLYKVDIGLGMKDTIFAMTPEVGSGFWPAASEVVPTCQDMVFPNMLLSHMAHKYLALTETDPGMIATMTGDFNHDYQRLGFVDGSITVTAVPLLNVQSVGAPIAYDIALRASGSGTISYVLDPAIQFGDEIKYILETDYGTWTQRDTITKTFGSLPLQFADDASNENNWTGDWTTTGLEFVSPTKSFTDGNGNYSNNADEVWTYASTIDLSIATQAMISYYAMWEIEADYDYCQFQVSVDGGNTWIGQCGNYTVPGIQQGWQAGVQPDGEPVYEGTQASWVLEEISLSDYLGQVINVRFQLESDDGLRMDGFYFDDFQISYLTDGTEGLAENVMEVKTFPNPANEEVIISTSNVLNNGAVKVYDQGGKLVVNQVISEQANKFVISTATLPQGMYTIIIESNDVIAKPVKLAIVH
ncbi:MAG: M14 family zinc carboxypeptidase [Crocinitomicaceae bacterium]|nr:M14 family zinc carboxypeptidase [Crocinitomicaceae bacterium]